MRHKYETRGIVLSRTHVGEATTFVSILTEDLGLVHARAQSVRKSGAKLSHALATFAESSLVLVRGREGWRVAGAVLEDNWFVRLGEGSARARAGRVSGLLLRLLAGEAREPELYITLRGLFNICATLPRGDEKTAEAAEMLAVIRILSVLGLDTGEMPMSEPLFALPTLSRVATERSHFIQRINIGIAASGL